MNEQYDVLMKEFLEKILKNVVEGDKEKIKVRADKFDHVEIEAEVALTHLSFYPYGPS